MSSNRTLIDRVISYLMYNVGKYIRAFRARYYMFKVDYFADRLLRGKLHRLASEVSVSLTSYGERLQYAHYAITTILMQKPRPKSVVLWVAKAEKELVTESLNRLCDKGLRIEYCEDLKSHKKYFYAKDYFETAFITADDDIFYRQGWFAALVDAHTKKPMSVFAHRAHEIKFSSKEIHPYSTWRRLVDNPRQENFKAALLPTTGGGVLFPKGALDSRYVDRELIKEYCLGADDLWLKLVCLDVGMEVNVVHRPHRQIIEIPSHVRERLWDINIDQNEHYIKVLCDEFGFLEKLKLRVENLTSNSKELP